MNPSSLQKSCGRCGMAIGPDLTGAICAACLLEEVLEGPVPDGEGERALPFVENEGIPIKQFGRYELLEEIGRGGMGVVYKARQAGLGRIVALKMLLAGEFANADGRKQLMREARVAATLCHPNIVAIHEVGEWEGRAFFTMEHIEGRNLSELVHEGPVEIERAVQYVAKLARAVQYAHDHHVVHRDLKPCNVLVNTGGEPKLTDFGLTRSLADQTITIVTAGSPNFMAPEQAASNRGSTGRHTDVFGLGGILYYLLTGRPPFTGRLLGETLKAVLDENPVPPRKPRPEIPADVETICLKCLEKRASDRYQSAAEVAEDLERWRRREPILARAVSPVERARKWVSREPVLALLLVACLALLSFAGVLLTRESSAGPRGEDGSDDIPRLRRSDAPPVFGTGPFRTVAGGKMLLQAAVADFDLDGQPDVAAISLEEERLEIFHGRAGSGFVRGASYPAGKRPDAIAAGDFQGDGRVDLVCANEGDDSVSVFLGDGAGNFKIGPAAAVGKGPRGVLVADLNGDERQDIVTADYRGDTLTVLFGDGRGGFSNGPVVKTGTNPWGLAAIDFDQDGRMDLVNTDVSDFTVRVFRGDGAGGFELADGFPARVGARPFDAAVADLDRDGKQDILTADTGDGTITILFGAGRRLAIPAGAPLPQPYYPRELLIEDLNRDGFLDIVTANESGSLGVIFGDGRGGFTRDVNSPYPVEANVHSAAAADVNGDGWPDVIAVRGTEEEGGLQVFLNELGR